MAVEVEQTLVEAGRVAVGGAVGGEDKEVFQATTAAVVDSEAVPDAPVVL